jgi:dihydrofolate reductase
MGKVILDMSMSLDGFVAGPKDEDGGLHHYFFSPSAETSKIIEEGFKFTGAIIMGRRSYDIGAAQDGFANNPYQVPTFILSSKVPKKRAKGAEDFVFVSDGIESAIVQAKAVVGKRYVVVGGGAITARQFLDAGVLDEIQIHLIPVLLGQGKRLFETECGTPVELDTMRVVDGGDVTHLRYRVVK